MALLVGYLIGISHVDPLKWNLTLERFLPEDMTSLPDIDLDFPRGLREQLIRRVHEYFGRDHAVLAGAISTYSVKGIIQDLGKALGLPPGDLRALSKQLHSHDARDLAYQVATARLPRQGRGARLARPRRAGAAADERPAWTRPARRRDDPLRHADPRTGPGAGRRDGRPLHHGLEQGQRRRRQLRQDRSLVPAGPDQLEEALDLIERRTGQRPDLSRIDPEDDGVYDLINAGQSKGVFLLQSPAQLKMGQRLKSRNLLDLAYQVALIRPGVGTQGSAVSQFVERYRHGTEWEYDHPLEQRALERGYGIILWQEQVVQLIMDVAGMSAAEADEVRRAFARQNNEHLIAMHRQRFLEGAQANGVPLDAAEHIFAKINGHYMFPESHSHAFAITAYQAAWLKCYYPIEFFTTLFNKQPMGFYPVEMLNEDARKFGVPFLNPCVNRSDVRAQPACSPSPLQGEVPKAEGVRLGLGMIKDIGPESARLIVEERERHGLYGDAGELTRRTGLKPQAVRSLIEAGAFDALWDAGLSIPSARNGQRAFPVIGPEPPPRFDDLSDYDKMVGEYQVLDIYPRGHVMEFIRPTLDREVRTTADTYHAEDGERIRVAGWVIARQHPRGKDGTVFVTIEDETGDVQAIVWSHVFAKHRNALRNQLIEIYGRIDRWDGTTNIVAERIHAIGADIHMPNAHDWH